MKFYNLKTRSYVDVPNSDISKKKVVRKTKTGGTQTRYQLMAEHKGSKLFKFISEADFKKIDCKEVK